MKPNTLYKMKFDNSYAIYKDYYLDMLGTDEDGTVLCLGEITNMPDCYIIVGNNGIVRYGLHSDMFVECTEDEV